MPAAADVKASDFAKDIAETVLAHGLQAIIEPSDTSEDGGNRAALRVLATDPRPAAVFAVDDAVSVGAPAAAAELGCACPRTSPSSATATRRRAAAPVGLTNVEIADVEVGRVAEELLLARIIEPARPTSTRLAEPSVVARTSTGPPPT